MTKKTKNKIIQSLKENSLKESLRLHDVTLSDFHKALIDDIEFQSEYNMIMKANNLIIYDVLVSEIIQGNSSAIKLFIESGNELISQAINVSGKDQSIQMNTLLLMKFASIVSQYSDSKEKNDILDQLNEFIKQTNK